MTSKHPFAPFIPVGAKKLIIGTIPPYRFCHEFEPLDKDDVQFYYGSKDNSFWDLLGLSFGKTFKKENSELAISERKQFLLGNKIGMTDIIDECVHQDQKSSDKDLDEIKLKDILSLLRENDTIDTLIYTSDFVKSLISTLKINDKYVFHNLKGFGKREASIKLNDKTYSILILYSPSPQALINMGENGKKDREDQYRKVFLNDNI
jgi:G:T/U-mismatch repair DNA glycosylase